MHESRAFTESRFTEGKTASRDISTGELALREIPAKVRNRVTDPRSKIKDSGANRGLALGRQRRCVSYLVFSEEIDIASRQTDALFEDPLVFVGEFVKLFFIHVNKPKQCQ